MDQIEDIFIVLDAIKVEMYLLLLVKLKEYLLKRL